MVPPAYIIIINFSFFKGLISRVSLKTGYNAKNDKIITSLRHQIGIFCYHSRSEEQKREREKERKRRKERKKETQPAAIGGDGSGNGRRG